MKKVIDFLKSEGLLCMLITFLVCSFLGIWTGLAITIIMIACNFVYIKMLNLYNVIGFGVGWGLSVLQHWIY